MSKKITQSELVEVLQYVFETTQPMEETTDLSLYIKDSIDLGEVVAVVKNRYSIEPENKDLFRKYTSLKDVLKIFNNEISS
jgi:acyl carrier protein